MHRPKPSNEISEDMNATQLSVLQRADEPNDRMT